MTQHCHVCGNRLISHFPEVVDPLTNETFAIHRCTECRLGQTVPRPKDLNRYYGNVYYGNRHGFTARYCTRRRLKFVDAAVGLPPGQKLLDVGCGDGSFLLAAQKSGWEVVGTEINPELPRSAGLDVRERVEQLSDLSPFDCITMWHTLEHMPDLGSMLSQLSTLLAPTGRLVIAVPDNGSFQARAFRRKWLHLDVPRHLYHFDAFSLSFCLRRAGFRIENQWHRELEYDLMGWSQSALNYLFREPNIFFNSITGKKRDVRLSLRASNFLLGTILSGMSLPAVITETWFGRGGTLIVSASRIT